MLKACLQVHQENREKEGRKASRAKWEPWLVVTVFRFLTPVCMLISRAFSLKGLAGVPGKNGFPVSPSGFVLTFSNEPLSCMALVLGSGEHLGFLRGGGVPSYSD